ncbi:MAG: hypothetical protein KAW92_07335 [Candidatus Cloacimonetes bacterium]|nr:hypothetical protein [Candidatus Cloacimonadota bacterium]
MPVSAIHLSRIELKSIKNNFLHYTTTSKLAYQTLRDVSERLTRLLTNHFGTRTKIDFEFIQTEKKNILTIPLLKT